MSEFIFFYFLFGKSELDHFKVSKEKRDSCLGKISSYVSKYCAVSCLLFVDMEASHEHFLMQQMK